MRIRRRDRDPSQPETEAEETQFEEPEPEDEPEVSEADEGESAPQPAAQIEADLPPEATHEAAIPFEAADAVITEAEPVEPPVDPISEPLSPERPASTSTDPETEVRAIPPLPTNPVRAVVPDPEPEPERSEPTDGEPIEDVVLPEVEEQEVPTAPEKAPEPPRSANSENFAERAQMAMSRLGELPGANGTPKPRPLPRVIAIANQKGGVGKTTTTVNLGAALSELDYRVLVVDLDPQGNATSGLGIDTRNFESSMYDVIMRDAPIEDCIEPTSVQNLFVTPATIDLAGVEIELVSAFSRELKLKRAIDTVVDDFDFVLIDCPPSLGLLTVNGLAAATEVLVPIQCEYYALEGLSQLLRNVQLVASNLNVGLEISAIVLTMYDARTRLAVDVADEVRSHFKEIVCRSIIPRTVRLSEAPSFGQPITVFDPSSRGAIAYRELAKEVSDGAAKRSG
jgi:chromosome partitioning protein